MLVSTLIATRDLVLAQLHGHGLRRLQTGREHLLDGGPRSYPATILWAQALHRCQARIDGLVWVSRLHDTSFALVLFGDRVRRADLDIAEPPLPLALGTGLEKVQWAAEQAGVTLLE